MCAYLREGRVGSIPLESPAPRRERARDRGRAKRREGESLEVVRDRRYVYDARYVQDGRLYIYTEEGPERSFSTASQRQ